MQNPLHPTGTDPIRVERTSQAYRDLATLEGELRGNDLIISDRQDEVLILTGTLAERLFYLQERGFREPVPSNCLLQRGEINYQPVCWDLAHCAIGLSGHPRAADGRWLIEPFAEKISIEEALKTLPLPFLFQISGSVKGEIYYPSRGTSHSYTQRYESEGTQHVGLVVGISARTGEPIVFEKVGTIEHFGYFKYWSQSIEFYRGLGSVEASFESVESAIERYHAQISDGFESVSFNWGRFQKMLIHPVDEQDLECG